MNKPRPSKDGARPRQMGTLMLRLYGDERAQLQVIQDFLENRYWSGTHVNRSTALRWAIWYITTLIKDNRIGG